MASVRRLTADFRTIQANYHYSRRQIKKFSGERVKLFLSAIESSFFVIYFLVSE